MKQIKLKIMKTAKIEKRKLDNHDLKRFSAGRITSKFQFLLLRFGSESLDALKFLSNN